jgi:hypothetical protein
MLVTRIADTLPGLVGALFGGLASIEFLSIDTGVPTAVLACGTGIVVAVRGFRMSVEVDADRVRVRGLLATRTIPLRAIRGLTPFPALRWESATGRVRWTPLIMFFDADGQLAMISEHNERSLATLRRALAGRN